MNNNFQHDYNLAVDSFNKKDYISFFRNIRPAIELLCKLIIHDLLNNETEYSKLVEGKSSIHKSPMGKFVIEQKSAPRKPTGSALAVMFMNVYYHCYPDVLTDRFDSDKKRMRKNIESYSNELNRWYGFASEIGSHPDGSNLKDDTQARACATSFAGLFDFLKSNNIISNDSAKMLDSLAKFSFSSSKESELNKEIKKINEENQQLKDKLSKRQKEHESEVNEKIKELEALRARIAKLEEVKESDAQEKEEVVADIKEEKKEDGNENRNVNPLQARLKSFQNDWDLTEESMDDDQLDLIDKSIDSSMLVSGCAGSGKSVIAMHKAEQIANMGYSVILIALTRSLADFMGMGREHSSYTFYYYHEWEYYHEPTADYIIVDEIQDFDRQEIQSFMNAAKRHYLFFGDSAQSIYKHFGRNTLTIEEIAKLTKLTPLRLYNNYRLPRNIAKITQDYVGVDVMPYKEKVYLNKEKDIPYIVHFNSDDLQLKAIADVIASYKRNTIGVLLPSNEKVLKISEGLLKMGVDLEYRCKTNAADKRSQDNINFYHDNPKVLTYHSAKGLQFDIVILPSYEGASSEDSRKALYVAMTRSMHKLYIMYTTKELTFPLSKVPPRLYKKDI